MKSKILALLIIISGLFAGVMPSTAQAPDSLILDNLQVITPENASQLTELMRIGRGYVTDLAWSPDGQKLVVATTIGIWIQDGLGAFPLLMGNQNEWITVLAFSPDGKHLAAGGAFGQIYVWDFETGDLVLSLHGHSEAITDITFSPNGRFIASGDYHGTAKVWDANSGNEIDTVDTGRIMSILAFSPNSQYLALGTQASPDMAMGEVALWNLTQAEPNFIAGRLSTLCSLFFSQDGSQLFIEEGLYEKECELSSIEIASGIITSISPAERDDYLDKFQRNKNSNGIFRAYITSSGIQIDDENTGAQIAIINLFSSVPTSIIISAHIDSNNTLSLLTAQDDWRYRWRERPNLELLYDPITREKLVHPDMLPNMERILIYPNNVQLSDILLVASSGEESFLAIPQSDQRVNRLILTELECLTRKCEEFSKIKLKWEGEPLYGLSVVSNEAQDLFAVKGVNDAHYVTRVWNREGEFLNLLETHIPIRNLSPKTFFENRLYYSDDNEVFSWNFVTGEQQVILGFPNNPDAYSAPQIDLLAVNSQETYLAMASQTWGYDIVIGDLATRELHAQLETELSPSVQAQYPFLEELVYDLAFNADGKLLATGHGESTLLGSSFWSRSNSVRIWDVQTGQEIITLTGHTDRVSSVLFSDDGKLLFTGSWDGTVRIWGIPAEN